jgi:hypothetical protein
VKEERDGREVHLTFTCSACQITAATRKTEIQPPVTRAIVAKSCLYISVFLQLVYERTAHLQCRICTSVYVCLYY